MTTVAPINQRGSCDAFPVEDMDFDGPVPPGAFEFYSDREGGLDAGILFGCPCGCGQMHSVAVRSEHRPKWEWNGNRERPTLTPSILIYQVAETTGEKIGEHWHGFLADGVFRSC